ncbi:MAG: 1-acyl-sn-glycerol-3-phosphate acyltransferase [Deltaproteobacteria bacterium]|nr:1-acyl-sn-glycerol-3-phosphate acyltransferase [Deltaproteobacteria bacterium]MBW2070175.1 1-acyl-sn-glycerol-3-phosphate acyltransferase [Deltaproteobacteria bacterium]
MLRTLLFYISLIVLTPSLSLITIPIAFVTKSGRIPHLIARFWSRCLLLASGIRLEVEGLENIDPQQSYVFAANHQSQFDIFALLVSLPVQFRWLAKAELFRIPIFGSAMKGAGYIPIDRSDRKAAFKSIDVAAAQVRRGTSIVIFPEGTRSVDGKLRSFKKGGFFLAIKSKRPIVPISISGSHKILAKGSFRVHSGTITIKIGKPIATASLNPQDREWLIPEIRRRIQENLPLDEQGEPEPPVEVQPEAAPETT